MDLACRAFTDLQGDDDSEPNISHEEDIEEQTSLDEKSIPGWNKVDRLAAVLVKSESIYILKHVNIFTLLLPCVRFKNQTRVDEVKILLQGIQVSTPEFCSRDPLPPANVRPNQPSSTKNPMQVEDPTDTTGQANVRGRYEPTFSQPEESLVLDAAQTMAPRTKEHELGAIHEFSETTKAPKELPSPTVSRTTAWRKRKAELSKNQTSEHKALKTLTDLKVII